MSPIHVFRSCLCVPIKSSAAGPNRPTSEEKHHFPAHKCFFLVSSLVLQRWSWGRKAVNHDRAAHMHVCALSMWSRSVFGGDSSQPVMAASSREFPSMCLASKVSLQRRRGSGSIKLQVVFCIGLRTDVQQNQLSGQRSGAGTMANIYKRSGSKPIKIRSVQRSVSI